MVAHICLLVSIGMAISLVGMLVKPTVLMWLSPLRDVAEEDLPIPMRPKLGSLVKLPEVDAFGKKLPRTNCIVVTAMPSGCQACTNLSPVEFDVGKAKTPVVVVYTEGMKAVKKEHLSLARTQFVLFDPAKKLLPKGMYSGAPALARLGPSGKIIEAVQGEQVSKSLRGGNL